MKKKLVIATHNENKVKEFKEIFKDTNYEILSLHDINFHDAIIEDGSTFQDNALIKALAVHHITKLPVIADDSGLSISALEGFPGVNSARFMEEFTYTEKNLKIIEMLKDHSDKSAKFIAAIALVGLTNFPQVFVGEVKGLIINEERGTNGFGYDPIFFYPDYQKTFAELTISEKKSISHRGVASELLLKFLNELED
ncbi:MAG: RdgB/HAM1 family non-canonical purine NTP pyrophosphatase [Bacilli bacterium]